MHKNINENITWKKNKIGFEWNCEKFIIFNKKEICKSMRESALLNSIIDCDAFIGNWENGASDHFTKASFDRLIIQNYCLSALDRIYNFRI